MLSFSQHNLVETDNVIMNVNLELPKNKTILITITNFSSAIIKIPPLNCNFGPLNYTEHRMVKN